MKVCKPFISVIAILILLPIYTNAQTTYTWNNTTGGIFTDAANWTPNGVPADGDIIVFNAGGSPIVSGINTGLILSEMRILGNTQVEFTADASLNFTASYLYIEANSSFLCANPSPDVMTFHTETAEIYGEFTFDNAGHQLISSTGTAGSVTFYSGSAFNAASGYTGTPFGSYASSGVIKFEDGAAYFHHGGQSPMGSDYTNPVCEFAPNSHYHYMQGDGSNLLLAARTFGIFHNESPNSVVVISDATAGGNMTFTEIVNESTAADFKFSGTETDYIHIITGITNNGASAVDALSLNAGGLTFTGTDAFVSGSAPVIFDIQASTNTMFDLIPNGTSLTLNRDFNIQQTNANIHFVNIFGTLDVQTNQLIIDMDIEATLNDGSTLITANGGGIIGSLSHASYTSGTTVIFNGTVAQNFGSATGMPDIGTVTVNNPQGVYFDSYLTINTLNLEQGSFYINGNTVQISGIINYTGGVIGGGSSSTLNFLLGCDPIQELRFEPGTDQLLQLSVSGDAEVNLISSGLTVDDVILENGGTLAVHDFDLNITNTLTFDDPLSSTIRTAGNGFLNINLPAGTTSFIPLSSPNYPAMVEVLTALAEQYQFRASPGVLDGGNIGTPLTDGNYVAQTWHFAGGGLINSIFLYWPATAEGSTFDNSMSYISLFDGAVWPINTTSAAQYDNTYSMYKQYASFDGYGSYAVFSEMLNSPPTAMNSQVYTDQNMSYVFSELDFNYTDPENDPLYELSVENYPLGGVVMQGTLYHDINQNSSPDAGETITPPYIITADDLNAGMLIYEPPAGINGAPLDSFYFKLVDTQMNMSIDSFLMQIFVGANQPPTAMDTEVYTEINQNYSFSEADFNYSDPENDPMNAVSIELNPNGSSVFLGNLFYDENLNGAPDAGETVIPPFGISAADLNNNMLIYSPPTDISGMPLDSFFFKVEDSQLNISLDSFKMNIFVQSNTPPESSDADVYTMIDNEYVFSFTDFHYFDADGDAPNALILELNPDAGAVFRGDLFLDENDDAVYEDFEIQTPPAVITASDINMGRLVYVPPVDQFASPLDSFYFSVEDAQLNQSLNTYRMRIHVMSNESFVLQNSSYTVREFAPAGTSVGFLKITDNVPDREYRFELLQTPAGVPDAFALNAETFEITVERPLALDIDQNPVFKYTIAAYDAANASIGDTADIQIDLIENVFADLEITNFFSPNNDGHNDYWEIGGSAFYPNLEYIVFDQSGNVVFRKRGYSEPWDGNVNNTPLPPGVYYYIIRSADESVKGTITLVR